MQLSAAIDLFIGQYDNPATQKAFRHSLIRMRDWLGPSRHVSDIEPSLVLEYFQKVVMQGGYAAATVQKHVKAIKTFFNWAVRVELVVRSPAAVIKGKKLPRAVDRSKAMSDDELSRLIEAVRFKPRDFALILFLADTGCRRGGAAGLRMEDVDWKERTATVTEKGDKSRKVVFGEDCYAALVKWLAYRNSRRRIVDVYLFSFDGKPIRPEAISLVIRRAARAAGVRVLSSHSLRHRKGHMLADARVAPSIAATALGHSDPMITLTYYYPADWASARQALEGLVTKVSDLPDTPANVVGLSIVKR